MHFGKRYYCDQCDYSINKKFKFKEHVEREHEGKVFKCEECEFIGKVREAAKKIFLVALPLRGGGGKALATKKL